MSQAETPLNGGGAKRRLPKRADASDDAELLDLAREFDALRRAVDQATAKLQAAEEKFNRHRAEAPEHLYPQVGDASLGAPFIMLTIGERRHYTGDQVDRLRPLARIGLRAASIEKRVLRAREIVAAWDRWMMQQAMANAASGLNAAWRDLERRDAALAAVIMRMAPLTARTPNGLKALAAIIEWLHPNEDGEGPAVSAALALARSVRALATA